jgi:hypothetical protein
MFAHPALLGLAATEPARTTLAARTGRRAIRSALRAVTWAAATRATITARSTRPAALAARRMHLLQLRELLGRQDLFQLGFHIRFQIRELLLLVVGEVQPLIGSGREDMHPAARSAGTVFAGRRLLPVRRGRGILGQEQAGGGAERQYEK